MRVSGIGLSPFVNNIREFQNMGLINKAALDVIAYDIPVITFAKTKRESLERGIKALTVFTGIFLLAPLHAKFISYHIGKRFGRKYNLSRRQGEELLKTSYRDLRDEIGLKESLKQDLESEDFKDVQDHINENFRKDLLKHKTLFGGIDLSIEGAIFGLIGLLKVAIGKMLTGSTKFTGEVGLIDQNDLDQIYQNEKPQSEMPLWKKTLISVLFGIALPSLLHLGLYRMHRKPQTGQPHSAKRIAHLFDYNYFAKGNRLSKHNIPMVSNLSCMTLSTIITISELLAARSGREFREVALTRILLELIFYGGIPAFMKVFNKGKFTVDQAIYAATGRSSQYVKKEANRSAWAFVASYMVTIAAVTATTILGNNLTRHSLSMAQQKLNDNQNMNSDLNAILSPQ